MKYHDYDAISGVIVTVIVLATLAIILAVLTAGCVSLEYTDGKEKLKVFSLLKSVEGLQAGRDGKKFYIVIDKTHTHDPTRPIADLMEQVDKLYGMGLRYDPDWRSPLMPDAILDPQE
jgi:hypothetical protein